MPASTRWRLTLLLTILAALSCALILRPAFDLDPSYHAFTDRRLIFGIPNALDVLSNAAFAAAGVWGLLLLGRRRLWSFDRWARLAFYASLLLTAAGSAYYHSAPDNSRLFWDRLPMTIGFMSVSALLIAGRVSPRSGKLLFLPLLILGPASVLYWRHTVSIGHGDLRPYILVQALPLLLILLLVPWRGSGNYLWLSAAACYGLAKLAESFDAGILHATGIISGHTLKHLLAALACCFIIRALQPSDQNTTPTSTST